MTNTGQFARVRDLVGATGPNRFAIYEKFGKEALLYETLDYYHQVIVKEQPGPPAAIVDALALEALNKCPEDVARLLLDRSLLCWQLHELLGVRVQPQSLRVRLAEHPSESDVRGRLVPFREAALAE